MKKFLLTLLLFVCSISVTFGASGDDEKHFDLGKGGGLTKNSQYTYEFVDFPPYNGSVDVYSWDRNYLLTNDTDYLYSCIFVVDSQSWGVYSSFSPLVLIDGIEPGQLFCTSESNIFIRNGTSSTLTFYYIFTDTIPTSDIYSCSRDLATCQSDLLTCQNDNSNCTIGYSNLYINNILHPGEENIYIDIPDYIYWDYSINEGNFNVYVGSGYDQDYIDGVLSINTYKPSSEDFTQVFVSGLTLIFPYIFVALFIIFVWKLLRRVFK